MKIAPLNTLAQTWRKLTSPNAEKLNPPELQQDLCIVDLLYKKQDGSYQTLAWWEFPLNEIVLELMRGGCDGNIQNHAASRPHNRLFVRVKHFPAHIKPDSEAYKAIANTEAAILPLKKLRWWVETVAKQNSTEVCPHKLNLLEKACSAT